MVRYLTRENAQTIKAALFFLFFALLLSTSTAFGGTPQITPEFTGTVGNLANMHSNADYGQRIINWIAFGKPDNVRFGEKSLLSTVSLTLNAIALVMMAYLSMLGGLTYVIQTANKGTPGGQVISSFWMPIRIATATILLVPLSSGYSTVQYGVITVAEKGNAHGSYLMDQGIDYIVDYGTYRPPVIETNKDLIIGLVWSELCRIHITTKENNANAIVLNKEASMGLVNDTIRYSYDRPAPPLNAFAGFMRKFTSSDKKSYCGSVTILTPDADTGAFLKGKTGETANRIFATADYEDDAAILATEKLVQYLDSTVIPAARKIAQELTVDGSALNSMQNGGGQSAQSTYERMQQAADSAATGSAGSLNKLVSDYDSKLHEILQASVIAINKHNTSKGGMGGTSNSQSSGTPKWVSQVKDVGWPALGTVFWQISKNQEALNYLAKRIKADYSQPKIDEEYASDERFLTLYSRLADLTDAANRDKKETGKHVFDMSALDVAGADGSAGAFKSWIAGKFQSFMLAMFIPEDDGDLITKLQYSGSVLTATTDFIMHAVIWNTAASKTIVDTSENGYLAGVISASSAPMVGAITGAAATIGLRLPAWTATFTGHLGYGYMQFISTLIVPLLIAGFALAIVLPAIPLFFWLMGVVSWMLFFVECLLISPMWLAAHGTADKDGWGTEHTRQGYMLMIGLYLNPILRVAGFFGIFLVLIPLGKMVGWLSDYLTGVMASGWLSPVIIVGSMIILAVFAYSAAVRAFSLPNELYERGLRWVNGGQEVTGDSGAEQQNRMIIAQVGGKADGAASAARHLGGSNPPKKPSTD